MSLSTPNLKLLLDENVNQQLLKFLKNVGWDVKVVTKGSSDTQVAALSKKEKRILVTNDEDFSEYSKGEIYSVVWLRVPQGKPEMLAFSFEKLLKENKKYHGKLILLYTNKWEVFNLFEDVEVIN